MKKEGKNKKKVIGAIGLATAAVCCFGIAPATSLAGNGFVTKNIVKAYADDTFTTQWKESIEILKEIDGDISTRQNYVEYLFAYINASSAYAMISATVSAEDYFVYEQAGVLIRADAECYAYFANTLSALYTKEDIRWSAKEQYDLNVAYFNSLDSMKQEVMIESTASGKFEEMRAYADSEFTRIQTAMDNVVDAINNIYYNSNGDVVVDSKASLDVVAQAIETIYGVEHSEISAEEVDAIAKYVTQLNEYDQAVLDYNAIVSECEEMDERIINTYNAFTSLNGEYYNKYYTQRIIIETLRNDFDALNRAADDDATTLVVEVSKLVELETTLADIDADKNNVINLISVIPSVFDYTDGYIATVNDAKEAFDSLPEDLKEIAETEIADYAKLTQALKDIDDCAKQVINLVEKANNLQVLYNEGNQKFSSEVNAVAKERTKLAYQKQKVDFDAQCGELLFEMQTKLDNLSAEIKPFIDAVLAIGEVKLSNTLIGSQIGTAYAEYAKLDTTLEQNAVLGYKKSLDEKKAILDELMQEANEWKVAVEKIVLAEKINTQNIEDIKAVELGLEEIKIENLDMYTVISTSGSTYGYATYEALIAERDNLLNSIEELANDMASLSTDLSVIVLDPTVFNQAVVSAMNKFNLLDDSVKGEYFMVESATNKAAYDNYLAALNIYEDVAKFAGDIAGLYDISLVDMTYYDTIIEYNGIYETLSEVNKEILSTQKINSDKTFKEVLDEATVKVSALKEARDSWSNKVYELVGSIEKANWEENLYNVNLEIVNQLKVERLSLDNTDGGLDQVDIDFALIEEIGNKRVNDLNDLIAILDAKAELERTDVADLESIYDIYNYKLDKSQKDLVNYRAFEVLYNKYVFAQNFDEAVLSLYENVVLNGNYTTEVPVTVGILRSIYINFGSEMKALIQEYNRIDEIEAEYNAHVESDGGVLNLTEVYNELLSKIESDGSNLSAEITTLSNKIVEIEKAYAQADKELQSAIENAYKAGDKELLNKIGELQNNLSTIKANLEKADSDIVADIAKVREEIESVKTGLEQLVADTKAELLSEIETLEQSLAQAKEELAKADADNKAELQGKIDALTQTLAELKANLEKADSDIVADIAKVREEIESVKTGLEQLVADTKAELLSEISSLKDSLTTVTIILSIVSGLSAIGVVVLFSIKKKN